MSNLFHPVPVYVTRPDADGMIGSWTVGAIFGLLAVLLVLLNVIVWGSVGLYEAVRVVLG